jgi:hypothetical protein
MLLPGVDIEGGTNGTRISRIFSRCNAAKRPVNAAAVEVNLELLCSIA